jgi:hypothetical protein
MLFSEPASNIKLNSVLESFSESVTASQLVSEELEIDRRPTREVDLGTTGNDLGRAGSLGGSFRGDDVSEIDRRTMSELDLGIKGRDLGTAKVDDMAF